MKKLRERKDISWNERFMELANHIGEWSKDTSRGVGAVIADINTNRILSTGYNDFPKGVDDYTKGRRERPAKYLYTEHAERNAIYSAARFGVCLEGSIIYVSYFPCADCARAIIASGIVEVVTYSPSETNAVYRDSFEAANIMFNEANVKITYLK